MYAMFTARKLMLTARINNLSLRLMLLAQKQNDIMTYGANIADGTISMEEAANSPSSIFNRQILYTQQTTAGATAQATQQLNAYLATNPNNTASVAPNPQDPVYASFYQQALKDAAQVEQQKIAVIENQIDQERLKIETQLKAAQAELESVEKAEDQGIKNSAPKYGT